VPALRDPMRLRDLDALARLMRDRRETLRSVAAKADVSHQFLHELATGQKLACSRAVATGIAAALERPLAELFRPLEEDEAAAVREVS
jgi:post-segregation antitoxin (ccd killing protein)